jgi:WD40 repeat protein
MRRLLHVFALGALVGSLAARGAPATTDYSAVDKLFSARCLDCHSAQDPDAKLVLESFDTLMKGGENGVVVVPGKSGESRLVEAIEGSLIHNGKQIIMPPGRKRTKLKKEEIALIREWIDQGARPSANPAPVLGELAVPKIPVKGTPRNPINSLAHAPGTELVALGRYRSVELRSEKTGALEYALSGNHGSVNALAFSADGHRLFAGSGENGRYGEVLEWNLADRKLLQTFRGHKDAIYALAISPDSKILATGSYDQKIKLWDTASGRELGTLNGHNGCIYGLAFRPDGKILASASGDHTVKLWDVASRQRRDTLSQPLKEVFAVAFTPDGSKLLAGGADNRIRLWEISPTAAETSNVLLDSKFAAEGAILRLAISPDGKWLLSSADDGTVRLWDAVKMKEIRLLERQPDWAAGLDFARDGQAIAVGRLDGSLGFYDFEGKPLKLAMAKTRTRKNAPKPATEKPEVNRFEPRGLERGKEALVQVTGQNLATLVAVKSSNPKLIVSLETNASWTGTEAWLRVKTSSDLAAGGYDLTLANEKGESAPAKIFVDQFHNESEPTNTRPGTIRTVTWPLSYWGTLNPGGDVDELRFQARARQTVVFDLAAKSIGSKADTTLALLTDDGQILATQGSFDAGDPLLAYTFATNGFYHLRIVEKTAAGSPDHFYRITIGLLPEVIGVFPPAVQTNRATEIRLIGYNLEGRDRVTIHPLQPGETPVPLDPVKYRMRRAFNVDALPEAVLQESEPNDSASTANPIGVPSVVCGTIGSPHDADLYRFPAKAGQSLILETMAARRGSPVDTKIEVLDAAGAPIERLQLRAVRDSAINFRAIDSDSPEIRIDNWQEMELNQYLYLQGEVCRFFRMPQGPDSGFQFYTSAGRRRDYFDTSAAEHALDEPCYIVEPHLPGEVLPANGLPVFPLYYVNDDDGDRELGTDSRLHFTAPSTGSYIVRVTDNRGRGGARFSYRLTVREARPDFKVALNGNAPAIAPGAGRSFSVTATRVDGFEGAIRVDFSGIPKKFRISTPLEIQAGHSEAEGVIICDTNAVAPKPEEVAAIQIRATAMIDGHEVVKPVNGFDKITLGAPPKLLVACEPYQAAATNFIRRSVEEPPLEITIAPGQILPVWIKIDRRGHDDLVTFTAQNLPHGVIIDNIGLNGVLIPKEESRRQVFFNAAKWVPDTDRLFFIKAAQADEPSSLPVLLHVRSAGLTQAMK